MLNPSRCVCGTRDLCACAGTLNAVRTASKVFIGRPDRMCMAKRLDRPGFDAALRPRVLVSACSVQQLIHRLVHALHLGDVPNRDVRIADKEDVRFEGGSEDISNRLSILRASETIPHAEENLVEPGARFPEDIFDVGLEVAVVHDGEQYPGVVVEKRHTEVVEGADPRLPVGSLRLSLRQTFAEQFCASGGNLADASNFCLFPNALAGTVGLPDDL